MQPPKPSSPQKKPHPLYEPLKRDLLQCIVDGTIIDIQTRPVEDSTPPQTDFIIYMTTRPSGKTALAEKLYQGLKKMSCCGGNIVELPEQKALCMVIPATSGSPAYDLLNEMEQALNDALRIKENESQEQKRRRFARLANELTPVRIEDLADNIETNDHRSGVIIPSPHELNEALQEISRAAYNRTPPHNKALQTLFDAYTHLRKAYQRKKADRNEYTDFMEQLWIACAQAYPEIAPINKISPLSTPPPQPQPHTPSPPDDDLIKKLIRMVESGALVDVTYENDPERHGEKLLSIQFKRSQFPIGDIPRQLLAQHVGSIDLDGEIGYCPLTGTDSNYARLKLWPTKLPETKALISTLTEALDKKLAQPLATKTEKEAPDNPLPRNEQPSAIGMERFGNRVIKRLEAWQNDLPGEEPSIAALGAIKNLLGAMDNPKPEKGSAAYKNIAEQLDCCRTLLTALASSRAERTKQLCQNLSEFIICTGAHFGLGNASLVNQKEPTAQAQR